MTEVTTILRSTGAVAMSGVSRNVFQKPGVITFGNFDGMHIGHQALLKTVQDISGELGDCYTALCTFYPHPKRVLTGSADLIKPLTTLRGRVAMAGFYDLDFYIPVRFTPDLARLTADEFFERFICATLGAAHIVVGQDWHFGCNREGNVSVLQKLCSQAGLNITVVGDVLLEGKRVSSGRVRRAIMTGDVSLATQLLGRPYRVRGRVKRGERRGRELGFRTANLVITKKLLPLNGVYATRIIVGSNSYPAVTNVGTRPTFGGSGVVVETHILEAGWLFLREMDSLYSQRTHVDFIEYIRPEIKFSSKQNLMDAILRDVTVAKHILHI